MKILSIQTIANPNVYHHRSVLVMNLELENLADASSTDLSHFNERLLNLLPGLLLHKCSPGYEGGFVERLKRGTYMAHIIEHIALELSVLAGIEVNYGKSVYGGRPGFYKIVVRYRSEAGMKYLLESAVDIVQSIVEGVTYDLEVCLAHAKYLINKFALGPSTSAILSAAKKRNIPWKIVNSSNLILLGHGKHRQFFQSTTSSKTSDIAVELVQDKDLTKNFLEDVGIRVPHGKTVKSLMEAIEAMEELPLPLAVKPVDGNHGRGVTLNVMNVEDMRRAFTTAHEYSDEVIIEECLKGKDYRIIVVGGKFIAAAERTPAFVIGDGISTIEELIKKENLNPLRGEDHEKVLTKISLNQETLNLLAKNDLNSESVPPEKAFVQLKETANLSTGGIASDVTDIVHPEIKMLCERASRIVGLDICGVDLIAEDISLPLSVQEGGIIEVNAGPGIRMHHHPSFGEAHDVGGAIVDHLFPNHSDGRIPLIAITGTNGKTTVSRLVSHIISATGKCVGNTTTDGIYIDNILVSAGDTTGPASANTVLSDPSVEVAVLETARGGIVKRGLGYDWSDVGVLTNVQLDHVGQDGIETIDDILRIKSLVLERVRPGGTIIVNADSREIVEYIQNKKEEFANRKIIYFSLQGSNRAVVDHLEEGGHAYFLRDGEIIEAQGGIESSVIAADRIPLTMGGTARFHVANVMASIAAAHAIGIDDDSIFTGLMTFEQVKNKGRTNLYRIGNGYLLLDYGHNADAIANIGEMGRKWNVSSTTAILTAPGDRSDELIRLVGESAAWSFDKIIIREDEDLRGRESGAISQILQNTIKEEKPSLECEIVLNSYLALRKAVKEMRDNELIIFFYEEHDDIEKVLNEFNPSIIPQADSYLFKKEQDFNEIEESNEWVQYSS